MSNLKAGKVLSSLNDETVIKEDYSSVELKSHYLGLRIRVGRNPVNSGVDSGKMIIQVNSSSNYEAFMSKQPVAEVDNLQVSNEIAERLKPLFEALSNEVEAIAKEKLGEYSIKTNY